jgi:hypothetical protein
VVDAPTLSHFGGTDVPRKNAKSVADAKAPKRKRVNYRIDDEAYEVLAVHSLKARVRPGKFLSELIKTHCKEWNIHALPTKGDAIKLAEAAA